MPTDTEKKAVKLGAALEIFAGAVGEFAVREVNRSKRDCEAARNIVEDFLRVLELKVSLPKVKNWKQAINYFEDGKQAEIISEIDERITILHSGNAATYFQLGKLTAAYLNLTTEIALWKKMQISS